VNWIELILPAPMEKDLRFAVREGGRTVGAGTITEIIQKEREEESRTGQLPGLVIAKESKLKRLAGVSEGGSPLPKS
jgi:hypothetical protein